MTKSAKVRYARHTRGEAAEKIAENYLSDNGLRLVTKNFHCKAGEIDLIFWDQNCLVFTEVRARTNTHFAYPVETIDYHKQKKIILTAEFFLLRFAQCANHACRFDVIGVDFSTAPPRIEWIKDAF